MLKSLFLNLFKKIISFVELFSPYYISISTREKHFDKNNFNRFNRYPNINSNFGILIQGPIVLKDSFTLETIKLYRYFYPNITIVFSTWKFTIPPKIKLQLIKLNVIILENDIPDYLGVVNVNLQITSTINGLKYLQEKKCNKVLKVRSDQRIYNSVDFLNYMNSLQNLFPINNSLLLKQKLVICSLNTFQDRLYGVSDMFMFGNIDDMLKYWDVPLSSKKEYTDQVYNKPQFYIKNVYGEGYFVNHFFSRLEYKPLWSEQDHFSFFDSYFIIIDKEQLDLFWLKYNRFFENNNLLDLDDFLIKRRYTFSHWLNNKNIIINEK
jgi:hypothetical protein